MKCTACGSTNLRQVYGLVYEGDFSDGNAKLRGDAYVCMKCGHIEIYSSELLSLAKLEKAKEDKIANLIKQVNDEKAAYQDKIVQLEIKVEELKSEINVLMTGAEDENITVKQHNELLKQIQLKEYEIARVQNEIKSVHLTINSCDEKIKRIKEKNNKKINKRIKIFFINNI